MHPPQSHSQHPYSVPTTWSDGKGNAPAMERVTWPGYTMLVLRSLVFVKDYTPFCNLNAPQHCNRILQETLTYAVLGCHFNKPQNVTITIIAHTSPHKRDTFVVNNCPKRSGPSIFNAPLKSRRVLCLLRGDNNGEIRR